jgi:Asp-tRNA(Asn)/Glu-tRNA(Gln) amidotransferase A subunit family amidase
MLATIAGVDPLDATSSRQPVPDYVAALGGIAGLRIGVAGFYATASTHRDAALAEAVTASADWGRVGRSRSPSGTDRVGLQQRDGAGGARRPLAPAQGAARHCSRRSATRWLSLTVTAYDYLRAAAAAPLTREFIDAFSRVDVLATRHPEPAPALAHVKAGATADVIARMGRFSRLTRPFSALRLPALSLPCGTRADDHPRCSSWAGPSTRPRSCAWATRTSARPRGIVAAPPCRDDPAALTACATWARLRSCSIS